MSKIIIFTWLLIISITFPILKFDLTIVVIMFDYHWIPHHHGWIIHRCCAVIVIVVAIIFIARVVSRGDEAAVLRDTQLKFEINPQSIRRYYLTFVLNARVENAVFGQICENLTLGVVRAKNCQLFLISIEEDSNTDQSSVLTVVHNRTYQFAIVEPTVDDTYH